MIRQIATVCCLLACAVAAADQGGLTEAQKAALVQHFGFGQMQIYKIKPGISDLELADLDRDGRTDVILWNAHQSRFELFYQPAPGAEEQPAPPLERNEVASRGPLRHENVPVAYRVATLAVADLTADGRPDIVFFGEPKEVVILPGREGGGFDPPSAVRAPDGAPRRSALAIGDFNHDGHDDVALLGPEVLQIFLQKPEGGLAKPTRIVHGIASPGLLLAADIDGDGRDDLAIGSDEDQYGIYVCRQGPDGAMSALRRLRVPDVRSMTFAPAEGGDDLFAIEAATGHLKHYRWGLAPQTGGYADWPQRLYSYPLKIQSKRIPFAVGDLDGDGLPDCVTADPEAAQFIFFRGTTEGLAAGTPFPGLMKTADLCIADLDGDGHNELLSVSPEEKTLGHSVYADGRLSFPRPLPVTGEPLAVVAGRLGAADSPMRLACVVRAKPAGDEKKDEGEEEEEDPDTEMFVRLLDPAADYAVLQSWTCDKTDEPTGLRLADIDQDGRQDLLLFSRYSSLQAFRQDDTGHFKTFGGSDTRDGLVRAGKPQSFCLSDVTGDGKPEVILAQKGLARALRVQDNRWTVVDQYNPETANAEITGLATLPGPAGSPTVVMYDRKARDLLVLRRREDNTYAVAQTMPVGNFDLSAMFPLTVGSEQRPGLLLADTGKLVLFSPDETAPTFVVQDSYETDAKDAFLADAVIGDLNHDGVRDVLLVDMRKAALEILTTLPDGAFVRAMRFQVFQGKRFSDDPDSYGEPHEVLIGDVDGDGVDDIALLVHDRLIIYPGQ
ncbi:MAG: VCBS repeat-containing protein [Phycisphaerae bacterium]